MAVDPAALLVAALPELRAHPTAARVRASAAGHVVVDSVRALVVWEPRRVVPSFAVPRADVHADLVPYDGPVALEQAVPLAVPSGGEMTPVLDPRTPFTAHSCPGQAWTLRFPGQELPGAGFTPEDPDLADHVLLDWDAFEEWREEDDVVVGHPHDPFDRIDCRRSSRHVVVSLDGTVLADTRRAVLLMETPLPLRFYVPIEDVDRSLLGALDDLDRLRLQGHRDVLVGPGRRPRGARPGVELPRPPARRPAGPRPRAPSANGIGLTRRRPAGDARPVTPCPDGLRNRRSPPPKSKPPESPPQPPSPPPPPPQSPPPSPPESPASPPESPASPPPPASPVSKPSAGVPSQLLASRVPTRKPGSSPPAAYAPK